jgi:hypothetical protein
MVIRSSLCRHAQRPGDENLDGLRLLLSTNVGGAALVALTPAAAQRRWGGT